MLAGGFPNETDIYAKFSNNDKFEPNFPKWFYAYLIAIMIIFVITAYFQYYKGTFSLKSFISFGKDRTEPTLIKIKQPTIKEKSA